MPQKRENTAVSRRPVSLWYRARAVNAVKLVFISMYVYYDY
eukprot:COSAG02_NODE_50110_length_322_cov_1.273543_1_plen_40_part_10